MADFLLALAAFDRARRWADLGHASLWAFLHVDLGLSAGAAHWRKVAAQLVTAFPAVEAGLRQGHLCLTSIVELAKVLTRENEAEVLPRFHRLSSREAKEVVAELAPVAALPTRELITAAVRPADPAATLRAPETYGVQPCEETGPERASSASMATPFPSSTPGSETSAPPPGEPGSDSAAAAHPAPAVGPATEGASHASLPLALASPPAPAALPPRPATSPPQPHQPAARLVEPPDEVVPLTADLRRLHLTVPRRFIDKLAAARSARAHAQPGASSGEVLEAALDLLLARDALRRKGATARPSRRSRACAPGRISASVRREVWRRDEGRCQWPLEGGGVCGSTWRLELDHFHPKARGGPSTLENLRLLCGPHNAEAARRAFGDRFMAQEAERSRPATRNGTPTRTRRTAGGGGGSR